MSALFINPFIKPQGIDGRMLPLGTMRFYYTGTLNEAPVYDDDGDLLAQPVTADITGVFPSVYLDEEIVYRAKLFNAAGVEQGDADPIPDQPLYLPLNLKFFGAVGDGVTDDTAAVQAAFDEARTSGQSLFAPEGNYLLSDTIDFVTQEWMAGAMIAFAPGPIMTGEGTGKTIFTASHNGKVFNIDVDTGHSTFKAVHGTVLEQFSILKTGSPSAQHGIHLRSCFNTAIRQVDIIALNGNGVTVQCTAGDTDGSNIILLDEVEIRDCTGWGVEAAGASGFNEISFLKISQCRIENCGTAVVGTPTSGGIKWKGQILVLDTTGVGVNQNCGLYIPGEAGLALSCIIRGCSFENNRKRHIYTTGIAGFWADSNQFHSNDGHVVTNIVEWDGASFSIENVEFSRIKIRATSGNNPCTAFKVSGANANLNTIRIRDVYWDNYDFTGQTRYDGVQFDDVVDNTELVAVSGTILRIRPKAVGGSGNMIPCRLRGPTNDGGTGVPSTTGEWIARQVASSGQNRGNTLAFTGTTANGSPIITAVATPAERLTVGATVTGAGIPGATTIVSIDSTSQITLSANATADGTDVALTMELAAATIYNVYSFDGAGTTRMQLSTTAPVTDTVSGYAVRDGGTSFYWHGRAQTDSSSPPQFVNGVGATFLNAAYDPALGYMWTDSTGDVRISATAPASDTAGTVIGTQT